MTAPSLQPEKPPSPEVVVITGMAGAGRTTAAHALEDHGWYVVENMPPQLFVTLADLVARSPEAFARVAIVVDMRSRTYVEALWTALQQLENNGVEFRMVYLEAEDEVLVRRFEAGRRPHPLQGNARLLDGIQAEREVLADLRARADVVVDTSNLNVHGLATEITQLFSESGTITLRLNIMSFGFKYGLPADANFVADMRFIPNPHWVPELRPFTGREEQVSDYVLQQPGVQEFLSAYTAALVPAFEGYRRENKHYATLAVGCTGGKHRSVAVVEELARRLAQRPHVSVHVQHRDVGRE
ncbi:RNase adapter RapZ [Micrococcus sp. EYE_162]|uniref:RNase adapter RapZ n=1 Tax=Micrococcus TaxID=1269 RepID=UPI002005F8DD|nr:MULTISPECIES: RNase adapter RapZ [unclassified Micrococcus]MCK6095686.1 RNase adapter RapZ [Micrococcus sp. EYE_212]MCK6171761.1 RNase adapter RapZ [Micrococcus sp. EYE_162]